MAAGAKGKYQYWISTDGLVLLEGWARDGLTDIQIVKNMGISLGTLYDYKKRFPQISESLKKGKEIVDYEVENALLKSAKGYEYEEITEEPLYNMLTGEPIKGMDGKQLIVITKIIHKHAAPVPVSIFNWLKNRKPDQWRDKPTETSGKSQNDGLIESLRQAADKINLSDIDIAEDFEDDEESEVLS